MSRRRRSSFHADLSLHPETRTGIAVVALFALALLLFFGMLDMAGSFGRSLDDGIAYVFGWDRFFLPFFLITWAYYLIAPQRLPLRFVNVLGIILFFLTLNPLVHAVTFSPGASVMDAALRVAGGKLGEVIALPLVSALGEAGTITLGVALLIVALLLMFNATLQEVLVIARWIGRVLHFIFSGLWSPLQRGVAEGARRVEEARTRAALNATLAPVTVERERETLSAQQATVLNTTNKDLSDELSADNDSTNKEPSPPPKRKYPRVEIPFDLLDHRDQRPTAGDIGHNREVIRRTLETFGIPVEMADIAVGPTVTQFALKPSEGVKLNKITALHNDLALALAAHPIRIEAPIPGKSLVGIEVPNQTVATVGLRELLEAREFRERKTSLCFGLGKDVSGKPWVADLTRMPHLLVAGATGSGKSVCLNTLIMSYLFSNGPDDLRFIMVDPKRVELQIYNGVPHLITPVITKVNETVNALKWALREMDRRYDLLARFHARDLATYNARVEDHLPYLIIIIDELADLMATSAADVEGPIVRLAQMARAVGIHLVLATQRPSVDVITGLIKANIPARIAFAVASATDSRTILDQQGAEKLLGRGDMLFSTAEMSQPKRIQGSFVSESEIQRVVEYIKARYEPADYDHSVTERASGSGTVYSEAGGAQDDDSDPLLDSAKEEIIRAGKASASLLQRRLKVGYARAARLLDLLEQEGYIGPGDGAKPREILKADFARADEVQPATAAAESEEDEPRDDDV